MNDYTREQLSYERSRGRGRVIVCAAAALVLAAAVFAGSFLMLSDRAEKNPSRTAEETIVPNISANMISAFRTTWRLISRSTATIPPTVF